MQLIQQNYTTIGTIAIHHNNCISHRYYILIITCSYLPSSELPTNFVILISYNTIRYDMIKSEKLNTCRVLHNITIILTIILHHINMSALIPILYGDDSISETVLLTDLDIPQPSFHFAHKKIIIQTLSNFDKLLMTDSIKVLVDSKINLTMPMSTHIINYKTQCITASYAHGYKLLCNNAINTVDYVNGAVKNGLCIKELICHKKDAPWKQITTCNPFANTLQVLRADYDCGMTDAGLTKCAFIVELNVKW